MLNSSVRKRVVWRSTQSSSITKKIAHIIGKTAGDFLHGGKSFIFLIYRKRFFNLRFPKTLYLFVTIRP